MGSFFRGRLGHAGSLRAPSAEILACPPVSRRRQAGRLIPRCPSTSHRSSGTARRIRVGWRRRSSICPDGRIAPHHPPRHCAARETSREWKAANPPTAVTSAKSASAVSEFTPPGTTWAPRPRTRGQRRRRCLCRRRKPEPLFLRASCRLSRAAAPHQFTHALRDPVPVGKHVVFHRRRIGDRNYRGDGVRAGIARTW